jgi:VIT1/CCC1 family predicted Fe2+/Mn2+ transporter
MVNHQEVTQALLTAQKNEITEHWVYHKLAQSVGDPHNQGLLKKIAEDERNHYEFWKKYTHRDVKPGRLKGWFYYLISKIFGFTFGIKLMEKGEEKAQASYRKISSEIPGALEIAEEEYEHEKKLLDLIDEDRLRYVGSMVLGLNDALVELTAALAGLTLAFRNTHLIALAGLTTGIAASLSMAASEYLSIKSEGSSQNPFKASLYSGGVYLLTVFFLIFPYFLLKNYYACLGWTLGNSIGVILLFTFYLSVAKGTPFRKRFFEMAAISFGIAAFTFAMGFVLRVFFKIEA